MFDRKLIKYKNIIGFAYQVDKNVDYYYSMIYTYLVLYEEGLKFVKYKKIKNITDTEHNKIIEELTKNNYLTIEKWIEENKDNVLNKKILKKQLGGEDR